MDVNVMHSRARVLRTASDDVETGCGLKPTPWEVFGFTKGDIVTYTRWGEGDPRNRYSIGFFQSKTGNEQPIILHGEAEVLKF